jgi:hypothetical protein
MARTENFDAGHGMEHHNTTPAPEKPILSLLQAFVIRLPTRETDFLQVAALNLIPSL